MFLVVHRSPQACFALPKTAVSNGLDQERRLLAIRF